MARVLTPTQLLGGCLALMCLATAQADEAGRVTTEDDYFANVPVVLTASRLDQPLNEAPGAMTVIDRKTIRLSGARTLADVLRLVPGYLAGGWNGANPVAAYHIPLDDYGARNLVLIDGQSVYSSLFEGDTHRGMMDVMLEDIERIEVLRGANSAAYGANAMFGVINIITRHSADTTGTEVSVTRGGSGIRDERLRVGQGDEHASFRLAIDEQRDSGYINAYDDMRLSRLNGRADFKPSAVDDVMVTAGVSYLDAGDGFPGDATNPLRTVVSRDTNLNARWRHQVSTSDEVQLTMNYMEDMRQDVAPYAPLPAVLIDFSGIGYRNNIELQRKVSVNDSLRAVFGAGYKDERARSDALFSLAGEHSYHEERTFGTVEWRATPHWLFNGGLFVGQHSLAGAYAAPRLMANWLLTPEHTVRVGTTTSVRTPSLFEYFGDVRYSNQGVLLTRTWAARGDIRPERLRSDEVGYLGRFPDSMVTLDVRAYQERMSTIIRNANYHTDEYLPYDQAPGDRKDYTNLPGFDIQGIEYQLRWKPIVSGELWLNQSLERLNWQDPDFNANRERHPPTHATMVAWFQQLTDQWELSVLRQYLGAMTWRDYHDWMPGTRRTDLRLAYGFRLDAARAEVSFTVQALEGNRPFFLTRPAYNFEETRRCFLQLKLEL